MKQLKKIEVFEELCYNDNHYCYFLNNGCKNRDRKKYKCCKDGKHYIFIKNNGGRNEKILFNIIKFFMNRNNKNNPEIAKGDYLNNIGYMVCLYRKIYPIKSKDYPTAYYDSIGRLVGYQESDKLFRKRIKDKMEALNAKH